MPRRRTVLLAALVLVLGVAHVAFWYLPRERAARPDPQDLPGQLLVSRQFDSAFWIPYPHQNLAELRRGVGDWRRWMAAASRLAGLPPPALPAFGPFAVPPSRELALASDSAGRRVVLAARVYPSVAVVARLAGWLAGNPWLAGGEVTAFGGRARVSWRGTLWRVASAGAPNPVREEAEPLSRAALAAVRLGRPVALLPADTYLLARRGDGLELASRAAPPDLVRRLPSAALGGAGVSIFAAAGPGGPLGETTGALALFEGGSEGRLGELLDLPGAVAFGRPGKDRFLLPLERLPGPLRGRLARAEADGWRLVASDAASLARAEPLAPAVASLLSGGGDTTVRFALWLRPAPAVELLGRVSRALDAIPLVDPEVARRWRDRRTVAAPLARFSDVGLVITSQPSALRLELRRGGRTSD